MSEDTFLGKSVVYKTTYDRSLIVPVARQENRATIGIDDNNPPFVGIDVWNAYEISCLTKNGIPVVGFAKISYSSNNKYIVESKSLKLYLNSFNMTRLDTTSIDEAYKTLQYTIAKDLTDALKTPVSVRVFPANCACNTNTLEQCINMNKTGLVDLDEIAKTPDFKCDQYNEDSSIISSNAKDVPCDLIAVSHSLRSNCKVTKQPDWGAVFISMKGNKSIDYGSLYKYVVSFRNESHFHEEICETIYSRLYNILTPQELLVACFYTRRGGIDINPIRASNGRLLEQCRGYFDLMVPSPKHNRQ